MAKSLEGKVALVPGASGGLGAHFARLLAGEGAAVALCARRLDRVESLAGALAADGHTAMAIRLDVADAQAVGPAARAITVSRSPAAAERTWLTGRQGA